MFLDRAIEEIASYVKTRITVFFLNLNAKACMIEHAFLGRFRDEIKYQINHTKAIQQQTEQQQQQQQQPQQ